MVAVTYDWDSFKAYAEHCRVGTYSIHDEIGENKEIRVKAGKLGFKSVLNPQSEWYKEILEWCRVQGYIKIEEAVSDELFHA